MKPLFFFNVFLATFVVEIAAQSSARWGIVPKQKATKQARDSFTQMLKKDSEIKNLNAIDMGTGEGPIIWFGTMNKLTADKYKTHQIIEGASIDKEFQVGISKVKPKRRLKKRAPLILSDVEAPADLKVVSQPKSNPPVAQLRDYKYSARAGEGIVVYIVDTGANIDHPEFAQLRKDEKISFMYFKRHDYSKSDYDSHGTCVLSKLAGETHGVAKKPTIVVAKIAPKITVEEYIEGFKNIIRDIMAKDLRGGKAIINLSQGIEPRQFTNEFRSAFRDIVGAFYRQDVPFIVSAGNQGPKPVDFLPAVWESINPNMIVVGAVDNDGNEQEWSQTGQSVTIWAPGKNLVCPTKTGRDWAKELESGTSFAAPKVAGLAAYFLSLPKEELGGVNLHREKGKVAENLKKFIIERARPRKAGGPKVLWNLLESSH